MAYVIASCDYKEKKQLEDVGYKIEDAPTSLIPSDDIADYDFRLPEQDRMYMVMVWVDCSAADLLSFK